MVEALARGEDATAERARLSELGPPASRRARPTAAREAVELREALEAFRRRLGPPAGEGPVGPRRCRCARRDFLADYEALRAHDLLMRERFAGVRRTLAKAEVGGEIVARLDAAEAAYRETMDRLLDPLLRADGGAGAGDAGRDASRPPALESEARCSPRRRRATYSTPS